MLAIQATSLFIVHSSPAIHTGHWDRLGPQIVDICIYSNRDPVKCIGKKILIKPEKFSPKCCWILNTQNLWGRWLIGKYWKKWVEKIWPYMRRLLSLWTKHKMSFEWTRFSLVWCLILQIRSMMSLIARQIMTLKPMTDFAWNIKYLQIQSGLSGLCKVNFSPCLCHVWVPHLSFPCCRNTLVRAFQESHLPLSVSLNV